MAPAQQIGQCVPVVTVADEPLLGLLLGFVLLGLAWLFWTHFPRYERLLRRVPGVYGRLSGTRFLAAMGAITVALSVVEAVS